jgi:hypothetical protein
MKPPLIKLSACVVIAVALGGCTFGQQQCKIDPPPGVMGTNKEMSAKAAANALGTAIAGGEVGGATRTPLIILTKQWDRMTWRFTFWSKPKIAKARVEILLVLLRFCALPVKSLHGDTTCRHRLSGLPRRPRG